MLQAGSRWEVRLEMDCVKHTQGAVSHRGLKIGKEKPPMKRIKWEWSQVSSGKGGEVHRSGQGEAVGSTDSLRGYRRPSGSRSALPYMLCDPGMVTPPL